MDLSRANNDFGSSINNMSDAMEVASIDPRQLLLLPDVDIVGSVCPDNEQHSSAQWQSSKQRDLLLQLNEAAFQTASCTSECTAGCQAATLSDKISTINSNVAEKDAASISSDDDTSIENDADNDDASPRFAGVGKRRKKHRSMKKEEQIETIGQLKQQIRDLSTVQSQPENPSRADDTTTAAAYQAILDRELSGSKNIDDSLFSVSPMKATKKRGRKPKNVDETAQTANSTPPTSRSQKKQKTSHKPIPRGASKYEKTFNAKIIEVLNTLRSMRDHKELTSIVDFAHGVLSTQESCQEPLKRLVEIDAKYRAASKEVFDELIGFLDYYGAIPKGGLDG